LVLKTEIEEIIKVVKLKKANVYLLSGDIIKIEPIENVEFDVEEINQLQEAKRELLGDKKHGVIFVTPHMGDMTKEAKILASGETANKNAIAKAVVLRNLGMRIMAQFFISFNKPSVEHAVFQNEKEALVWLREKIKSKK